MEAMACNHRPNALDALDALVHFASFIHSASTSHQPQFFNPMHSMHFVSQKPAKLTQTNHFIYPESLQINTEYQKQNSNGIMADMARKKRVEFRPNALNALDALVDFTLILHDS
ncbi:MAG: hypothetical protein EZS28_019776 [Streblomastix strix]|uniref:Uncharacterized protein n=1 Tax=Streblomastix strix TaxID=222440 RepID=A0A5J4VPX3_9EUKA|nr:MAG: hypothetical protein EZS28_019776 [Streblomastix strix]